MKKRRLWVASMLMLSLGMTACGAKEGTPKESANGGTAAVSEGEEMTTISFLTKDYYGMPEMADMLSEQFLEKTGVELKISHVPNNNWEEKITATFVSGSMPDIARLPADIYPFVKQDFLVPLDSYIEANPEVKAVLEANPEVIKPYQFFGNTYGMSITNQKYMAAWVRVDWLEKLGIEMPKDMESLEEMLVLFRDSDLDGNGKSDTIPLTLSAVLKDQDMFAAAFNTRNEVFMRDGKAVIPFITEEYKAYLDYMKHLYTEKLIDLEMPTNTSYGAVRTKFINGEAGAIIMWDDIYDTLKLGLEKGGNETAVVDYLPPFDSENGVFGLSYYEADSPIGITRQCKDPKAAFDTFFTWFLTDPDAIISTSRGVEGYSFDVVDGVCVPNADNNGVGFRGQSFPPVNVNFEYPYEFDEVTRKEYDSITALAERGKAYGDQVVTEAPPKEFSDYYNIKTDLTAKATELFHNYVLGNITYEEYTNNFAQYMKEVDLERIIADINK